MKNAQQVQELMQVIRDQLDIIEECAKDEHSDDLVTEQYRLEMLSRELFDLIEKELAG